MPRNDFFVLSINHKLVSVKNLENYHVKYETLRLVKDLIPLELYLLQTCNRMEIYAYGKKEDFQALLSLLNEFHKRNVTDKGVVLEGVDAVKHAFEVASGVDSLAVGEYEILRQMREALESSRKAGLLGRNLEILITEAIKVGRKVRLQTGISRGKVGTYVLAVEEAKDRLGDLRDKRVLVIGAGEIAGRLLTILYNEGVRQVTIMNRTKEKAIELASKYGYNVVDFDLSKLDGHDVVFSAINYPGKVHTDKFVVDLGVPPVFEGPNVVTLAEIEKRAQLEKLKRAFELKKAEELIESYAKEFITKFEKFSDSRALSALMGRVEEVRKQEVERALWELKKLGIEGDEVREILDKMSMSILKKVFDPFFKVYYSSSQTEKEMILNVVRKVFSSGNVSNS
ncbi:MAG: glutamyl-tRNA reductase [Thermoprotei archaeon]